MKKKCFGIGIGAVTKFKSQVTSVFDGWGLKKRLRKDIKKIICSPTSDSFWSMVKTILYIIRN